jgi:hypothetical protein
MRNRTQALLAERLIQFDFMADDFGWRRDSASDQAATPSS